MAVFKFNMQSILNIKEKLESQQKAKYAMANKEYLEEVEKLDNLEKKKESYELELKDGVSGKLKVTKIIQLNNAIENMKFFISEQKEIVFKAEKRVEDEREKLNEAIKERKTYEKLKEKAFEKFLEELKKEDDKINDELVSFRHGRNSS